MPGAVETSGKCRRGRYLDPRLPRPPHRPDSNKDRVVQSNQRQQSHSDSPDPTKFILGRAAAYGLSSPSCMCVRIHGTSSQSLPQLFSFLKIYSLDSFLVAEPISVLELHEYDRVGTERVGMSLQYVPGSMHPRPSSRSARLTYAEVALVRQD